MKDFITSALMILVLTVALGVIYPLAVWGVAQVVFPQQANGSLIEKDGKIIGSELIGQQFASEKYFHSRLSANNYDAANSGGTNLGPASQKLIDRVKTDALNLQTENPNAPVPADLVTTSASGLDPHISPSAAEFQIPRIARVRNLSETDLRKLVDRFTENRQFGIFGEPRVNVLKLNLELDKVQK
ncbi:MAG TPA: potassium-transporting ATPase subunit KdpC [Pyrinomonadaceae bacterium]|nr:potassium-transporting ATPase subunit KdpC [Pyrinomonadaceae bacterium]